MSQQRSWLKTLLNNAFINQARLQTVFLLIYLFIFSSSVINTEMCWQNRANVVENVLDKQEYK